MKKSLIVLLLAITVVGIQACGTKSNDETASALPAVPVAKKEVVLTPAERKAKLQKERAERAEMRKLELAKLANEKPTFKDAKGNIVYNKAELDPSFTGGDDAMVKYLRDNLTYPKDAKEKGLEGTVFVDFIVSMNGGVREVDVTDAVSSDVDPSFRKEAIRVVTAMPRWVPGRQHGKPVDVRYSIPITFELM